MPQSPLIVVCGPRRLPAHAAPQLAPMVAGLLAAGSGLAVGCAAGADALALAAAVRSGAAARVSVFAVGGADGAGFAGASSAFAGVRAAALSGARVHWWAGGPATLPMLQRLAMRSMATIRAALAGGPRSGLVAFVNQRPPRPFAAAPWPSCGSGTWATVAAAVRAGLPVVVVPVGALAGAGANALPMLPGWGSWQPIAAGKFSSGFRWVSTL